MSPPDETWVPEWEPDEEASPGLRRAPSVEKSQPEEPGEVLTDDDMFDSGTSQHQALAEEVMAANAREHRQQAVAAAIPGVDSGVLGFEDVTGKTAMATEEVEAAEQARSSDLVKRTISAVAMMAMVVLALYLGGWWLTGLMTLFMVVGLAEYCIVVRSAGFRPVALIGLLGLLGAAVVAHTAGLAAAGGVLTAAAGLVLLFYVASGYRMAVENSTLTVLGMIWISLLCFGVVIGRASDGVVLLIWVLLLNAVFDTAAYVVGRAFGSTPLSPSLSEKKTVQGLMGGVLATFVLAAVLSTLPQLSILTLSQALYLAAVVSVLAPIGDAIESALKRSIGIKDMSSFIPGHGGILDRIDGLLLVVPGAYYLFSILELL